MPFVRFDPDSNRIADISAGPDRAKTGLMFCLIALHVRSGTECSSSQSAENTIYCRSGARVEGTMVGADVAVCMRRRGLIGALVGATVLSPAAAHSQASVEAPKLGFVYPGPKEAMASRVDALVGGLRASGYPVPQLELVVRASEGDFARIAPMVAEVMQKHVAVIMAVGRPVLEAVRAATKDIPIVAVDLESDPIASGFADSIARPGHNLTGVFLDFPDFAAKLVQLLVESAPGMQRIAVLWDPTTGPLQNDSVKRTAAVLNLQTDVIEVRLRDDFERAFTQASRNRAEALIMLSSPLISVNVKTLADLAL